MGQAFLALRAITLATALCHIQFLVHRLDYIGHRNLFGGTRQSVTTARATYALYQAASLLEQLSVAIVYFAQSCETEIKTLCSDVQAGEGRILACLKDNDEQVGDTCRTAIAETVGQ